MGFIVGPVELLGVFLDVLGPVALIIAVGYFSGPALGVDARPLSRLAFWILGPAFMFEVLWDTQISRTIVAQMTVAAVAAMAAAAVVGAGAVKLLGGDREASSAAAMTSSYGNVGNTGLAISSFALGPAILPAAGLFMLIVNLPGMVLGIALAQAGHKSVLRSLTRALLAPIPAASLIAVAVNLSQVQPPLIITRSVGLVAAALIPVMLYTLGVQLAASGRVDLDFVVWVPMVAKLAVAPLVAWLVARMVGLDGDLLAVTVIQSAMPPAVFCLVVALEEGLAPRIVTSTVVAATLAATITVPVSILVVT